MWRSILVVTLCLFFLTSNGQDSRIGISFTPAFVQSPIVRYAIQPGLEYRINRRLSLLAEIAFVAGRRDTFNQNVSYLRIKPELRYEFFETRHGWMGYGGLQVSYSIRKWEDMDGGNYFQPGSALDSSINYSKAAIKSPIFTSSLQLGVLIPITRNLHIDLFKGLGVRMIFTEYESVENATKKLNNEAVCTMIPIGNPAFWTNGNVTRFHYNVGLRILYRF